MRRNGNPVIATVCGRCEKPQQVKGVIGKDEVSSSNLDSSSKRNPVTATVTGFFLFYDTPSFFSLGVNLG